MHADRTWPLFAVTDLASEERHPLGEILHSDRWEVRVWGVEGLLELPSGETLYKAAQQWLRELSDEADAANGQANGSTPLSAGRMEWRRILHNNHLRIGPARRIEPSL